MGHGGLGLRYNKWLYRVRAHSFRRVLKQSGINVRSARILDVGSGSGFYLAEWLRAGAVDLTGSDLAQSAIDGLTERFPGMALVRADIGSKQLPFPPQSFDVISAFDVLFHIVDDARYERAIHNLSALLREGGFLFLSENFLGVRPPRREYEPHITRRSANEIETFVNKSGLVIAVRQPMFVLMNAPNPPTGVLRRGFWEALRRTVGRHEVLGVTLGAILFPFELALVDRVAKGPSTELILCRKVQGGVAV